MCRRIALGLTLGAALLLALDALAVRLGVATGALPKVEGITLWLTSRAAGVTAFTALTLDVVLGLLVAAGLADRWVPRERSVDLHRWLSTAALALTAAHALALLGDRYVRFDVLDLAVPFLSSYRPVAVALGVLAAYGALAVHLSFRWRRRLGAKGWRRLHTVSFVAFGAALLHGVFAGSDSAALWMRGLYISSAALVLGLGLYRAVGPVAAARPQGRSR